MSEIPSIAHQYVQLVETRDLWREVAIVGLIASLSAAIFVGVGINYGVLPRTVMSLPIIGGALFGGFGLHAVDLAIAAHRFKKEIPESIEMEEF